MPINGNTFNSRVTSEALEKKFRDVFPAQGGAELVQDLYASGVITPVIDFSSVAEGSVLSQNLQTAWDFATGNQTVQNTTTALVSTPGFYKVDLTCVIDGGSVAQSFGIVYISDGLSAKNIFGFRAPTTTAQTGISSSSDSFVVFLRAGDSMSAQSNDTNCIIDIFYRQIADVSGNLVNPLGFTFS